MAIVASTTILNGKYKIVREIGEGGMGRVWLAEEIVFGSRPVALKEPRTDLPPAELDEVKQRYAQEVQINLALQKVEASNVVPVYTVEPFDGSSLLSMAFMPNGDLAQLLTKSGGKLPVDRALEITTAILQALRAAHEHPLEIVHRDVKPSNILFDGSNRPYLADFGLAQLSGASSRSQGQAVRAHPGTPAYMAPEQAGSTAYLTPAADIYAVGCVLFEMVTGSKYKRVRPGTLPSSVRPEIPAGVDVLVAKATAADPFDRYADAGEMLAALKAGAGAIAAEQQRRSKETESAHQAEAERQYQSQPQQPVEQPPSAKRIQTPSAPAGIDTETQGPPHGEVKKWRALPTLTIAIVLLALIGGGYWLFGRPQEPARPIPTAGTATAPPVGAAATEAAVATEAGTQAVAAAATTIEAAATEAATDAPAVGAVNMDELIAAAKAEGELTTIALPHDWCNYGEAIEGFKSKYGITVNELNPDAGSGDELEAIRANKNNKGPQAPDVIDVGFAFGPQAKDEGLLQPYKVSTWGSIPAEAKDPDGYWYGDYYGVMSFMVNKDVVTGDSPKSWADLLKDEYMASVALSGDPRTSNQAILAVQNASLANGGTLEDPTKGLEFFAALNNKGNLVPVIANNALVARGETPIRITWDYNALAGADSFGGNPPVEVVIPTDSRIAGVYVQGISAYAPHPNAAKLWMEYLYSDEGQLLWMKGYCRPIREADLRARSVVPAELKSRIPDASGVVFPTVDQLVSGKAVITSQWDNVVGAEVKQQN